MSTPRLEQQQKGKPVFWRDSNLPFEARQAFDSTACYRAHTHPTLSIGIVDHGKSLLSLAGRELELKAGDVVIVWPRQVHACNPQPSTRWSYRMFYLDWDWVQSAVAAQEDLGVEKGIPQLVRSAEGSGLIDRMSAVVIEPGSVTEKIRRMQDCLVELYKHASRPSRKPVAATAQPESLAIRRARDYIETHAAETIDLRSLALDHGFTPFQFIRKFGQEIGLTPHAYQLDQRIIRAKKLLVRSQSLVDIAYALGFADQSHFQRVFKPRVAATPAQYRGCRANQAEITRTQFYPIRSTP